MKLRVKKIIEAVVILGLSGLMITASVKMFRRDVGQHLNEANKVKGQITKAYPANRKTGGNGLNSRTVFAFNLSTVNQTLGAYRPSQDYTSLAQQLHVGDTITVYYRPSAADEINIDVYQIEKGGSVVLDYDSYEKNHSFAAILCGVFGAVSLLFGIRQIIREKYFG